MGLNATHFQHLPHRIHIATAAVRLPTAPGWAPVVLVAVAIFALGLWWVSTRV